MKKFTTENAPGVTLEGIQTLNHVYSRLRNWFGDLLVDDMVKPDALVRLWTKGVTDEDELYRSQVRVLL